MVIITWRTKFRQNGAIFCRQYRRCSIRYPSASIVTVYLLSDDVDEEEHPPTVCIQLRHFFRWHGRRKHRLRRYVGREVAPGTILGPSVNSAAACCSRELSRPLPPPSPPPPPLFPRRLPVNCLPVKYFMCMRAPCVTSSLTSCAHAWRQCKCP